MADLCRYTSLQANYLSIPVYILASIGTGLTTYVSDRLNRRAICMIHAPLLVMTGYAIAVGSSNKAAGFAGMFLVGAGVYSYNTVLLTYVLLQCQFTPLTLSVGSRTTSTLTRNDPWPLQW